jgi:hypothetical protein
MIRVFINFYNDPDPARELELRAVERMWSARTDIELVRLVGKPDFDQYMNASRGMADAHDISIMLNSDCYIDERNTRLFAHIRPGEFWCLSKWNVRADGSLDHHDYEFSQDAWAWVGVLSHAFSAPFPPGMGGCDGSLAARAHDLGMTLRNPSREVRVCHYHQSNVRRWQDKPTTPGPYKYVQSTRLT